MSEWYYVDASRIRRGPLEATALRALAVAGEIHAETRVWRGGMPRWQALWECAADIGLSIDELEALLTRAQSDDANAAKAAAQSDVHATSASDDSHTEAKASADPPALPDTVSAEAAPVAAPVWHHAGLAKRFAAFMIDELILTVALMPVMLIFALITGAAAGSPEAAAMNLLRLVATWLYFAWCESSSLRGTIGKRALGIYVTRPHGAGLSFGRASARFVAKIFGAMAFMIGIFLIAVHPQRQGLHDQVTDTYVVADNAEKLTLKPFEWILIALGIFAVLAAWSTLQAR